MARKRELHSDDQTIHFEARTETQQLAVQTYLDNDLTFLTGASGAGKTTVAIYCALMDLRGTKTIKQKRRCDKIIITRPIVEAGEYLGALPGEIEEKVHPYMMPIYACVSKMVHHSREFIEDNFELSPLAFMRGSTFEHSVAILDEAQNCTVSQIKLFLTRLGNGSKMVIAGDMDQSDIGKRSGLRPWVAALKGKPGIGFVEFKESDIVRHPLVQLVLRHAPKG